MLNEDIVKAHAKQNQLHTAALLAGLGLLVAVPVWLIWGLWGLIGAALVTAAVFTAAWQTPPELLMRAYSAKQLPANGSSQLTEILAILANRAGLPAPPKLYIIPSLTLNAFATGTRKNAAIAITEGLLRKLEFRELAAVIAHEVSHIKNNDTQVMAVADFATRTVQLLSYLAMLFVAINIVSIVIDGEARVSWLAIIILYLSPLLSSLLQLGLSRTREYDADLEAAQLTGNPSWLASALQRLENHTGAFWQDLSLPVPGRKVPVPSILRTHPHTEDRITRLREIAVTANVPPLLIREEPFVSVIDAGLIAMRPRYRFPGVWY